MDMYSVRFTQHIPECGVIVLGVLGKPLLGEERRRSQELCVGLDVSLLEVVVSSMEAIPFLGGVHRYSTSFKVRKWKEVREVKDEENGEINVDGEPHTS